MFCQFSFFDINVVDFLLIVQELKIVRIRDRFRNVENIFRKKIVFENFTLCQFFQFECVLMKIVTNQKFIFSKIKQIIERIDSTFQRDRGSKKNKKK